MLINGTNITALNRTFNAAFQRGIAGVSSPDWEKIATKVLSTTGQNDYGWLGDWPEIREWVGERVLKQLAAWDYAIKNKKFENTVRVQRTDIADDNLGLYGPRFEMQGNRVANFPNKLVFQALANAFTGLCYDGQAFVDNDHPVQDSNGGTKTVSNFGGGTGDAWFLMINKLPLKPIIYQEREKFKFTVIEDPKNDHVFMRDEYLYGVDGRCNVGYGLWQFVYGSKQPLTAANYKAAKDAMAAVLVDSEGEPLGLGPDTLVVGKSNKAAGRQVIKAPLINGGESNIWFEDVELMETDWLK